MGMEYLTMELFYLRQKQMNVSNNDVYWKQARAYYWLQQEKKVNETYVKVLESGNNTQFIFNANKIRDYWTKHKLPSNVKKYGE